MKVMIEYNEWPLELKAPKKDFYQILKEFPSNFNKPFVSMINICIFMAWLLQQSKAYMTCVGCMELGEICHLSAAL